MADFPSMEWFAFYKKAVDQDSEMKCVGKYFDADFLLDFGGREFLVKVREGKILDVMESRTPDDFWEFAIRWSLDGWKKFSQPIPPPMHTDLFAGMYGSGCTVQGDTRVFMGNLKALFRMLAIMRDVKA